MTTKQFGHFGIQLDADFASHKADCEQCRTYDANIPASAAGCCLEGSVLLKRELAAVAPRRQSAPRSEYYTTKDRLNQIMQYK